MPYARLKYLFDQHLANTCTEAEKQELAVLLLSPKYNEDVKELLQQAWEGAAANETLPAEKAEAIIASILSSPNTITKTRTIPLWRKIAAVAAILLLLSVTAYFIFNNKEKPAIATATPAVPKNISDINPPAVVKATITLVDGRTVPIDSITSGTLAIQGAVNLVKNANGQLVYNGKQSTPGEIQYNTLNNPKGSKVVDMVLADGSRVWLNAGSSITFPVAFAGNERKVSMTGEAYFEVTHNTAMPFKVLNGKTEITDLGTQFNVNAYDNEADLKVTLLEGSVKINNAASPAKTSKGIVMKPGEQAQVTADIKIIRGVDVDKVMAWKNGVFNFQDATLEEVMRQLERWYDIDVVYEKEVPKLEFIGKMSRDLSLSNVLHGLEVSKVHFRLEGGRRLVVLP